jgi:hypothetical protein
MKKLNEFNVGDVVTNDDGEVFEIKAIYKTGSVKVFVKEVSDDGFTYLDVVGNEINSGKTYTVDIPEAVFRLVDEEISWKPLSEFNVGNVVTNKDGDVLEIKDIYKTGSVKVFVIGIDPEFPYSDVNFNDIKVGKTYTINTYDDLFRLVEIEDKSVDVTVGEMYRFYSSNDCLFTGIVIDVDISAFTVVDSWFDVNEYTPDEFYKIEHVNTPEEKIIANSVSKFFNEEFTA